MTYNHPKMPCNMAHQIDFHIDHDIVTAIALPNDIPVEADVDISKPAYFLSDAIYGLSTRISLNESNLPPHTVHI